MKSMRTVAGAFRRASDDVFDGWCWSPDAPGDRRVVELVADDRTIATTVAATAHEGLARHGIGDGKHAFRMDSVRVPEGATILSLRDAGTGIVVARQRLRRSSPVDPRLDQLSRELDHVRCRLSAMPPVPIHASRLGRGFASVGARLAQHGRTRGVAVTRLVHAELPPARMGRDRRPAGVRVVILSRGASHLGAAMRSLRRVVGRSDARTTIVAAEAGGWLDIVRMVYPAADLFDASQGGSILADAVHAAIRGSVSGRLICVDAARAAEAPADQIEGMLADRAAICVDDDLAARLVAEVLGTAETVRYGDPLCRPPTLFRAEISVLHTLGGLDPAFAESSSLAVADLALRAAMLGHHVMLRAPLRPDDTLRSISQAERHVFTSRWRHSP
jgi:hypothetical protein